MGQFRGGLVINQPGIGLAELERLARPVWRDDSVQAVVRRISPTLPPPIPSPVGGAGAGVGESVFRRSSPWLAITSC